MTSHIDSLIKVATQISTRVNLVLSELDLEMNVKNWPADFREIMWEAVANEAKARARAASRSLSQRDCK